MSGCLPLWLPNGQNLVQDLTDCLPPDVGQLCLVIWQLTGQGTPPLTFLLGLGDTLTKAGHWEHNLLMAQLGGSGPDIVTPTPWIRLTPLYHS
jgi:hypothetical protein